MPNTFSDIHCIERNETMREAFEMAFGSIHNPLVEIYKWIIEMIPA